MTHVRWIALPLLALGLVLLAFGLLWQGAVQLGVGGALVLLAALVWRSAAGARRLGDGH